MKIRVQTPPGEIELCSRCLPNGRTIWSQIPDFRRRVRSEKQQSQNTRFREATLVCPECRTDSAGLCRAGCEVPMMNAYSLAVSDWFHPPEILEVDITEWTGEADS